MAETKFTAAGYYSVWQFGECRGSAYGTPTGVAEWAASKWGLFCRLEPCTEECAAQINRH